MKKLISVLLLLTMVVGLFAGCVGKENPTTAGSTATVAAAKEYLYAMYKDSAELAVRDFSRVAVVMIDGVKFNVVWTADVAEDLVKITATETMATIDINEKPAEDFTFTLTATLTDADGKSESVSFKHSVKAPATTGTLFVDAPEVGVAYKFALQQNKLDGQPILYFTGEKSGNYLATSTNPLEAVDVTVEETEGGYHLTFMDGETKKYINITTYVNAEGVTKKTQDIGTEPTCVYTWDAERKTMVAEIEGIGKCYLGTYNTYNTISTSEYKYIENLEVVGVDQFVAGFCTINAAVVEKPETGKAYIWGLKQNKLDGQPTLYFTGEKSGNYLATSTSLKDAVRVYLEEAEGGYYMFFLKDGAKTYINITTYVNAEGVTKKTQDIGAEPLCVYTWDAERKTMVADIEGIGKCYLGTYNTYNTISTSEYKYIENVEVVGVDQFPAGFYDMGLPVEEVKPDNGGNEGGDNGNEGGEVVADPTPDTELSVKDAIALGASKEHNTYTEGKYYVSGEITEIYNTQYGNMKIKDSEGNILTIYGTFSADGKDRFDAMAAQPKVGDTVKIYGIVGQYNGTPQIKNGWIVVQPAGNGNSGSTTKPDDNESEDKPSNPSTPDGSLQDVTELKTDKAYYIESAMANGSLYLNGVMGEGGAAGRAMGTNDLSKAVAVKLEAGAAAGEYYIYFEVGGTKTYLSGADNKSAGLGFVTAKDDTCVWVIDVAAKTIINKAISNRGLATQVASSYENFSFYSTTNLESAEYDWCWLMEAK